MKTVKQMAAQGDVMFRRVKALPDGVKEVKRNGEKLIVAHSETGHHHVVKSSAVRLFTHPTDALLSYLTIQPKTKHVDVVHMRPFDTHETLRLMSGGSEVIYEIRRQREWTPEGWRIVAD